MTVQSAANMTNNDSSTTATNQNNNVGDDISAKQKSSSSSFSAPKTISTFTAGDYLNEENTPRDVRLLHLLLASQGVTQYEDIVPLQLMDFAYRYTRGVLKDAVVYNDYSEHNMAHPPAPITSTSNTNSGSSNPGGSASGVNGSAASSGAGNNNNNSTAGTTTGGAGAGGVTGAAAAATNAAGSGSNTAGAAGSGNSSSMNQQQNTALTVDDIRLAIAARTQYQFKPTAPPKELLLQLAQERNKKVLPKVPNTWGIRLPPEKYCLTNTEIELDSQKK